jgi:hypothetical protein
MKHEEGCISPRQNLISKLKQAQGTYLLFNRASFPVKRIGPYSYGNDAFSNGAYFRLCNIHNSGQLRCYIFI